jgi:hypothetical protein
MPTLKNVKKRISEAGVSPELQEALFEGCEKYVNEHIGMKLVEMISDNPYFTWLMREDNERIEAASFLAEKIQDLEEAIYLTERDSARLVAEAERRHSTRLQEDVLYGHQQKASRQRRSSSRLEADLYEANPDNVSLMNESHQERLEPNMARYLATLQSSTRADSHQVDTRSAAYLTETFEVTK